MISINQIEKEVKPLKSLEEKPYCTVHTNNKSIDFSSSAS